MADQLPIFDQVVSGSGSVGTEAWVNLGTIPNGHQWLLGYATLIAEDKTLQFELRSNKSGQTAGTLAATDLLDWSSASGGSGIDRDLFQFGYINTETVLATSAGEKLWLRVTSKSASAGLYDYIIRYAVE